MIFTEHYKSWIRDIIIIYFIIKDIIIIIIIIFIVFMQGIYNYIPTTDRVYGAHSAVAIL
jgi:hypothetical protein